MVVDFGDLKSIAMDVVGEPWDHAFMVYDKDNEMRDALAMLGRDHKTVIVPFVPTVENMATEALRLIRDAVGFGHLPFNITSVTLYETPNCWAVAK